MNKMKLTLFMALTIVLSTSCSMFLEHDLNKSETYKIDFNHEDWKSIAPDDSDFAYRNTKTNSIIFVNSFCKKYDSSTLRQLLSHLFGGIEQIKIESETKHKLHKREALRVLANGFVDGVKVFVELEVLKKNRCVYDFALVSTSQKLRDSDRENFEKVIKGASIH